jgi:hypothetical protein
MKYIISEDRKEDIIKQYIMSTFDRVDDVWYVKRSVYFGSGPVSGKTKGEQTVIIVLINNLDDELSKQNLHELKQKIINRTDKVFNLKYNSYGSNWEFGFRKKVIEPF